jgi:KipI family sensor histidine kinase inhibitor
VTGVEVRPAGDRGALLEVPDNPAAVRLAEALRRQLDDVVDVVPGHRTVLVTWAGDPPETDRLSAVADAALAGSAGPRGRSVEIPVRYDGPDLTEVARLTGLSPEDVVSRHSGAVYDVSFLGFQPGFGYLLGLDERLVVPRLDEPRTRVPAGTVAIAGPYSGVYPRESPGGWRLLGGTSTVLFDAGRVPPALLAPGDRVTFVPL